MADKRDYRILSDEATVEKGNIKVPVVEPGGNIRKFTFPANDRYLKEVSDADNNKVPLWYLKLQKKLNKIEEAENKELNASEDEETPRKKFEKQLGKVCEDGEFVKPENLERRTREVRSDEDN